MEAYSQSRNVEKRKRLYLLVKSVKMCGVGLGDLVGRVDGVHGVELCSLVLGMILF